MTFLAEERALHDRLANWRLGLRQLGHQVKATVQPLMDARIEGGLRSRQVIPRGPDLETPRTLTPDDDLAWLDHRRLEALAEMSLAVALVTGRLRTVPARREVTGECVTLVDLSRSMLSGCLAEASGQGEMAVSGSTGKLSASLAAAASVQAAAGGAQFSLRAALLREGGAITDVLRSPRPLGFSERVVDKMLHHYVEAFRCAQPPLGESPEPQTSIRQGLQHVLREVRGRGLVVIVSDFLEPVASWRGVLLEVMARHRVLLLDVGTDLDRHWPEDAVNPNPVLEGARHLEDGVFSRSNRLADIREWNDEVSANHTGIDRIIRGRAARHRLCGASIRSIYRRVCAAVRQLK